MHLHDLPRVPSALDDIVVILIPKGRRGYLWARELGQGAEVQAIQDKCWDIDNEQAYAGKKKLTQ